MQKREVTRLFSKSKLDLTVCALIQDFSWGIRDDGRGQIQKVPGHLSNMVSLNELAYKLLTVSFCHFLQISFH